MVSAWISDAFCATAISRLTLTPSMTTTLEPGVKESTTQKGGDGCTAQPLAVESRRFDRAEILRVFGVNSSDCVEFESRRFLLFELPSTEQMLALQQGRSK